MAICPNKKPADRVLPDPDFILWTGDNSPHDGDKSKRDPQITRNLRFIVKWMHETFGNTTKVVPVLGNHDSFLKDTFYDAEVNKTAARSQYRYFLRFTVKGTLFQNTFDLVAR